MILLNHHSGLKGRSTVTARATIIEHKIEDGYQRNILVVVASNDLSSAYDTVDHKKTAEETRMLWN